jgi:hypothetical protein
MPAPPTIETWWAVARLRPKRAFRPPTIAEATRGDRLIDAAREVTLGKRPPRRNGVVHTYAEPAPSLWRCECEDPPT